jgi:hypothetical protein
MAVRQRQAVLEKTYQHFKDFGLPLDIGQKEYMAIVGRNACCVITVKRSFKAWKYLTHALKSNYPELSAPKPEPKPTPVTPKAPKPTPKKAAVKPAVKPAVKKD